MNRRGQPFLKGGIDAMMDRFKERVGFRVHAHAFRHTFATVATQGGWNLERLRVAMGHWDYSVLEAVHVALSRGTRANTLYYVGEPPPHEDHAAAEVAEPEFEGLVAAAGRSCAQVMALDLLADPPMTEAQVATARLDHPEGMDRAFARADLAAGVREPTHGRQGGGRLEPGQGLRGVRSAGVEDRPGAPSTGPLSSPRWRRILNASDRSEGRE